MTTESAPQKLQIFSEGLGDINGVDSQPILATYYFLEPCKLSPEAMDFITTFYGTPNFGCIPLAVENHYRTAKARKVYDTFEVKVGPIVKNEFAVPQGLKAVKSRNAVATAVNLRAPMDDLLI